MTLYPTRLDVVIIGGSLAGLWAAVAIKSLPNVASITILERFYEEQLQDLGAGIRTPNEAVNAIHEFTQTPPEKYATPMKALRNLDGNGNLLMNMSIQGWTSTWGQLYRVLREAFDSDPKCNYRHGCTLQTFEEKSENEILVTYTEDGKEQHSTLAHILIGADGASSKVRAIVLPQIERTYAGYALYRGLVPTSQISEEAQKVFEGAASFSWPIDSQFVSYNVPANGAPADETEVLVNWVWYQNKNEDELPALLTDKHGHQHLFTLPVGGMRQEEVEKIQEKAWKDLPAQHAEIVTKTKAPFLQLATDSLSEQNCFYNGKVLLVGDALGGQRPHTATAFLQCAFHGIMIRRLLQGDIDLNGWSTKTQEFSDVLVKKGRELGDILLATMPPQEKVPKYTKLFMAVSMDLSKRWEESIGNVDLQLL